MDRRLLALVISLIALNLSVMALDVFLLPQTPVSQYVSMPRNPDRARGPVFGSSLESRMTGLVRREIQEAVAVQGDQTAMVRLRDHYRTRRANVMAELASVDQGSAPPRRRSERQPSALLLPFVLLQTGVSGAGLYLASLLAFGSLSMGALFLIPLRVKVMRDSFDPGWSQAIKVGAVGVLGYLLAVTLAVLLAATVVGLPIALLLMVALAPITVVGLTAILMVVGRFINQRVGVASGSPLQDLAVGVLLLFPLGLIPVIGWVVSGTAAILGFGAVLATKMGNPEGWSLDSFRGEQGL